MIREFKNIIGSIGIILILGCQAFTQISPGDLAEVHAHLEGLSNCTKCHTLGEKVSNEKCLNCHTEIKTRIDKRKGYHYSDEIRNQACVKCHNDHHGRKFEIIRFDKYAFDHMLTGYELLGAHTKQECEKCHTPKFITDELVKDKKFTYLGLGTKCLTCHTDYHQTTLPGNCLDCHNHEAFKPAPVFDHENTNFRLLGMHAEVSCEDCHKIETRSGQKFQNFSGVSFSNCTSCHEDVHQNQFGQDCKKCHTEESFHMIKDIDVFNHDLTSFILQGKHQEQDCKACHKTNYTDPLKHDRCTDCHTDYHKGEFNRHDFIPDCVDCHSVQSFSEFSFTIEQHNNTTFPLEGAHLASPCFECHLKENRWKFREIGINCADCHEDIHRDIIDPKYYPNSNCRNCHTANWWNEVVFDHGPTGFALEGVHREQSCRACHFEESTDGAIKQKFSGLSPQCFNCHTDQHYRQFEENGITDCEKCHTFFNWRADKFDHNTARFILDGKHENVACNECHITGETDGITYVRYKFEDIRCEACHQ